CPTAQLLWLRLTYESLPSTSVRYGVPGPAFPRDSWRQLRQVRRKCLASTLPTSAGDKRPMIFRKWTGRIRTEYRAAHVPYIVEPGLADYASTPGNRGCPLVIRDLGDGTTEVS